jgi:hypothetical protein
LAGTGKRAGSFERMGSKVKKEKECGSFRWWRKGKFGKG